MKKEVRSSDFPSGLQRSDQPAVPEAPLRQGPARITGTVLGSGSRWLLTTDVRGWSTAALLSAPDRTWIDLDTDRILRDISRESADVSRAADIIRQAVGADSANTELAVIRLAPCGSLVELLNVSLPTLFRWDPKAGLSSYERGRASLGPVYGMRSEVLRLRAGSILVLTTSGILPVDSCFREIAHFARSMGIEQLGGTLADTTPSELSRVLQASWSRRAAPAAMVMVGRPPTDRYQA